MFWITNTAGKKDAVLTLTLLGFLVIAIKLLFAGSSLAYNGNVYTFGELDASVIAAMLTPTLGAYITRRYTDRKFLEKDGKKK